MAIQINKTLPKDEQLKRLIKYVNQIMDSKSFLVLKISFENGNIVNIKVEKNLKVYEIQ